MGHLIVYSSDGYNGVEASWEYYICNGGIETCRAALQNRLHKDDPNNDFDFDDVQDFHDGGDWYYGKQSGDEFDKYVGGIIELSDLDTIVERSDYDTSEYYGFPSYEKAWEFIEDNVGDDYEEDDGAYSSDGEVWYSIVDTSDASSLLTESTEGSDRKNRITESELFESILNQRI